MVSINGNFVKLCFGNFGPNYMNYRWFVVFSIKIWVSATWSYQHLASKIPRTGHTYNPDTLPVPAYSSLQNIPNQKLVLTQSSFATAYTHVILPATSSRANLANKYPHPTWTYTCTTQFQNNIEEKTHPNPNR